MQPAARVVRRHAEEHLAHVRQRGVGAAHKTPLQHARRPGIRVVARERQRAGAGLVQAAVARQVARERDAPRLRVKGDRIRAVADQRGVQRGGEVGRSAHHAARAAEFDQVWRARPGRDAVAADIHDAAFERQPAVAAAVIAGVHHHFRGGKFAAGLQHPAPSVRRDRQPVPVLDRHRAAAQVVDPVRLRPVRDAQPVVLARKVAGIPAPAIGAHAPARLLHDAGHAAAGHGGAVPGFNVVNIQQCAVRNFQGGGHVGRVHRIADRRGALRKIEPTVDLKHRAVGERQTAGRHAHHAARGAAAAQDHFAAVADDRAAAAEEPVGADKAAAAVDIERAGVGDRTGAEDTRRLVRAPEIERGCDDGRAGIGIGIPGDHHRADSVAREPPRPFEHAGQFDRTVRLLAPDRRPAVQRHAPVQRKGVGRAAGRDDRAAVADQMLGDGLSAVRAQCAAVQRGVEISAAQRERIHVGVVAGVDHNRTVVDLDTHGQFAAADFCERVPAPRHIAAEVDAAEAADRGVAEQRGRAAEPGVHASGAGIDQRALPVNPRARERQIFGAI
ncbi:MAG: hypothetical protein BWX70_02410 [Verrucomicrobia bacterium ADurb.Bin070]|nr:MAG: hypothetical protein BWX70_02410 [Verrucomicrobia bacterium ADurb.Bin070]